MTVSESISRGIAKERGDGSRPGRDGRTWTRRRLLESAFFATAGALGAPLLNLGRCRLEAQDGSRIEVSTRAVDVVLATSVIDMLALLTLDWSKLARWQSVVGAFGESDFRKLERSGIQIFHPAIDTRSRDPFQAALRWASGWNALMRVGSCFFQAVRSSSELAAASAGRRIGLVIGFQDSDHFRTVQDVGMFFGLGQRVSQLTYNDRNRLGSGCHVARDGGLTPYGAQIVGEMNRLGMAIDVSHCGERTSLDAIELSKPPVLVTHSNCRALVPSQPRCRPDALIRALAKKGGVMGITIVRPFVGSGSPDFDDLLDHFDHVRRLVGVEHVGLGSDVDLAPEELRSGAARSLYTLRGLDAGARVFQIADGLLKRGYSERDLGLVLGGNFRRALDAIWPAQGPDPATPGERDPFCPAPGQRLPPELEVSAAG